MSKLEIHLLIVLFYFNFCLFVFVLFFYLFCFLSNIYEAVHALDCICLSSGRSKIVVKIEKVAN